MPELHDSIDFEVDGESYTADLKIAEAPTPKFLRMSKRMQALAEKGEKLTQDEGVDSIILASDYLAAFGIEADDLPADVLFEVLTGLFEAMEEKQNLDPSDSASSKKPSRTTAKK